ncbi:MAG TPA: LacI family DNA-binding transcriptional regulator [Terriglobales bacterium]|jgi:LacI family transcriptional regulator|nr:LacI family DNA-binding transcriptional regulator [Terriglobales bacterium]
MTERTKHTMRDVARLAGVSTSTVSAVLNASVPVSPARKKRVMDAMAALDYHPDAVARGLKTGKTNVIGVVVPDITNAFYPEVVRGVEDAARKAGYAVLLCDSNEDAVNEDAHLATLFSRRVDGVLLACCVNSTAYATMLRRRFPMVFVDRIPPAAAEGTVSSDNLQAGYSATRHLIDLGHERIAMLAGHTGLSPHHDRLEGFRKAMQESHMPIRDEYLAMGGVQIENGLDATRKLLKLKTPPTAIMVSNNKLLLGVLQALDENKIHVPRQISLIGFDDYVWNRYFSPSITAVAQSTYEMGKRAFELLQEIMGRKKGEELSEKHIRLITELRLRNSTARPPEAAPVAAVS